MKSIVKVIFLSFVLILSQIDISNAQRSRQRSGEKSRSTQQNQRNNNSRSGTAIQNRSVQNSGSIARNYSRSRSNSDRNLNYHNQKAHSSHKKYAKLPHWGHGYKALPHYSHRLRYNGLDYHYHSGVYYKFYQNKYVVTRAPIGLRISTLPVNHLIFRVNGRTYFYYYGTYYVLNNRSEYITVAPPVGAVIDALPDGYRKVIIDNNIYYEFNEAYYKAFIDEYGEVWYEVVG